MNLWWHITVETHIIIRPLWDQDLELRAGQGQNMHTVGCGVFSGSQKGCFPGVDIAEERYL